MNIPYITNEEVLKQLTVAETIECVENVYKSKSDGHTVVWPTVFYEFDPGHADMDIKSGYLPDMNIFGHKTVAFMEENTKIGLPDLTGLIVVFSSKTGMPLGLVDGSAVTGMRTGAAAAIGARYLARKDSKKALIVGTGNQAPYQVAALLTAFPELELVRISNPVNRKQAEDFVTAIPAKLTETFGFKSINADFEVVDELSCAVSDSDIIITITPSRKPIIKKEWVKPGTHFSCIGADMEGKEEIDPAIFRNAIVYVDDLVHCSKAGEIEIPLKTGTLKPEQIKGEIGDLILSKTKGRINSDDITVFDATGMALLDLATANILLNKGAVTK
ncbi:MAG: ornithine cyclodeaminase family protein [Erysipelotrichaceae bacterium]